MLLRFLFLRSYENLLFINGTQLKTFVLQANVIASLAISFDICNIAWQLKKLIETETQNSRNCCYLIYCYLFRLLKAQIKRTASLRDSICQAGLFVIVKNVKNKSKKPLYKE